MNKTIEIAIIVSCTILNPYCSDLSVLGELGTQIYHGMLTNAMCVFRIHKFQQALAFKLTLQLRIYNSERKK